MNPGTITLLPRTVEWLNTLGMGDFVSVETPERMAWVVIILRKLPDDEGEFPHGKWATIQSIEGSLHEIALLRARRIEESRDRA